MLALFKKFNKYQKLKKIWIKIKKNESRPLLKQEKQYLD